MVSVLSPAIGEHLAAWAKPFRHARNLQPRMIDRRQVRQGNDEFVLDLAEVIMRKSFAIGAEPQKAI